MVLRKSFSITLLALSILKLYAVVSLVAFVIITLLVGVLITLSYMRGFSFLVLIAITVGIGYAVVKFYFLALINMIDSFKYRLKTGNYAPLDRLGPFLIISYISAVIAVLFMVINIVDISTVGSNAIHFGPTLEVTRGYLDTEPTISINRGMVFGIVNVVGTIVCLQGLKKV